MEAPRSSSQEGLVVLTLCLIESLQKGEPSSNMKEEFLPSQSSQTAPCESWFSNYSNLGVIQKFPFNKSLALWVCPLVAIAGNKPASELCSPTSQSMLCALSQWTAYCCQEAYPANSVEGCVVHPTGHQPAFPSGLRHFVLLPGCWLWMDHSWILPSNCP